MKYHNIKLDINKWGCQMFYRAKLKVLACACAQPRDTYVWLNPFLQNYTCVCFNRSRVDGYRGLEDSSGNSGRLSGATSFVLL